MAPGAGGGFLRQLQRLAEEFGVAIVVTNQVVAANLDGAEGMIKRKRSRVCVRVDKAFARKWC